MRAAIKAATPLGIDATKIMDAGGLVSDEIILDLVKERVARADCAKAACLDGFLRTIPQAEAVKGQGIKIDSVVEIDVDNNEIINHLRGRCAHLLQGIRTTPSLST